MYTEFLIYRQLNVWRVDFHTWAENFSFFTAIFTAILSYDPAPQKYKYKAIGIVELKIIYRSIIQSIISMCNLCSHE